MELTKHMPKPKYCIVFVLDTKNEQTSSVELALFYCTIAILQQGNVDSTQNSKKN